MVAKTFQIHGVKITGKYICESKTEFVYSWLQAKLSPRLLLSPVQAKGNYPFPPTEVF